MYAQFFKKNFIEYIYLLQIMLNIEVMQEPFKKFWILRIRPSAIIGNYYEN